MINLPPLPLIDGCLFVDNSMLEAFTTCPRALQYSRLNKRVSSADKPSLNFGSAIHTALEFRYRVAKDNPTSVALDSLQAEVLAKYFEENPAPLDDWRNLNWAVETIKRYNQKYGNEEFSLLKYDEPRKCDKCDGTGGQFKEPNQVVSCPWCSGAGKTEVMVELSFALELFTYHRSWPSPDKTNILPEMIKVIYTGKIDLPISLDGQLWILDHKTTSMLGAGFFDSLKKSAQQRGYVWAFEQLTGKTLAGFIVNAVRTKEPPIYVKEEGMTGKKKSVDWWAESLQRERFYTRPEDLIEWKSNTIALIKEFFYHYQQGLFPMKTAWCCGKYGRCQYFDVCDLAEKDRGLYLESGMFQDNDWSPLKEPSQPKQIA